MLVVKIFVWKFRIYYMMASPTLKRLHVDTLWPPSTIACCSEKGKGSDPCVNKQDCKYCNMLMCDQLTQLSTPTYKKSEMKHVASPSLVDAGSVLILGQVISKVSGKVSYKVVPLTHDSKKAAPTEDKKKSTSSKTALKNNWRH